MTDRAARGTTWLAAVGALVIGSSLVAAPADGARAPVRVSAGVATPVVTPFRDGVDDVAVLRLRIDRRARVKLFVADAAGRVVRKRYLGVRSAGLHATRWDARRPGGATVPSGRYTIWFRAYKDGYASVVSRRRAVRVQRQRLADRTTTLTVRGDRIASSDGYVLLDRDAGTAQVGHNGMDPIGARARWSHVLPARVGPVEVRTRMDLHVYEHFPPAPFVYTYRVAGPGGTRVLEGRPLPVETPLGRRTVELAWRDVSFLGRDEPFEWGLIGNFPNAAVVFWSYLDVRYQVLVDA